MSYPVLRLRAGCERRLRSGHPWLYSNEIRPNPELEPGSLVRVMTADGKIFGVAYYNPHSLIAARMLSRSRDAVIDRRFLELRLRRALDLRARMFAEPFYRLLHAEGDGLPGFVLDRYGEHLVVQLNTAGAERLWPLLAEALDALLPARSILLRNDAAVRELEGLPREVRRWRGEPPRRVELIENDLVFPVDPEHGQKTGWYYDQRLNRALVRLFARDQRVLDLYGYSGAFALNALAAGAREALVVDASAPALELARESAARQGVASRLATERCEVFEILDRFARERRRFGLVLADPPSFVKSRKTLASGLRAYRRLAELAARVTAENGVLCVSCCSHNVPVDAFLRELQLGIKAATRGARRLALCGQAPDHPVHPMLAETAYLKFAAFALD